MSGNINMQKNKLNNGVGSDLMSGLVTGHAQFSTVATSTLPGEMTATNAKPLNQLEVVTAKEDFVEVMEAVVVVACQEEAVLKC